MRLAIFFLFFVIFALPVSSLSFSYVPKQIIRGEANQILNSSVMVSNPNHYNIRIEPEFISEAELVSEPLPFTLEPFENKTIFLSFLHKNSGTHQNILLLKVSTDTESYAFQVDLETIIEQGEAIPNKQAFILLLILLGGLILITVIFRDRDKGYSFELKHTEGKPKHL